MKQFELSIIGEFHLNHNEDAKATTELGNGIKMIAVMDGCSMGKESHFASTLMAKLLRKIGKEISFKEFAEQTKKKADEYLLEILQKLFEEFRFLKNHLHLEREEVLSTLILGILDQQNRQIELITVGDGLIVCNGALFEYEQDDKPDYLGYHIDGDFKTWFQNQTQRLSLMNVVDLSISTDGIYSFKNFDGKKYDEFSEEEIVNFLLIDKGETNEENMFQKKIIELENRFGLRPSDDLTIIRIKMEQKVVIDE